MQLLGERRHGAPATAHGVAHCVGELHAHHVGRAVRTDALQRGQEQALQLRLAASEGSISRDAGEQLGRRIRHLNAELRMRRGHENTSKRLKHLLRLHQGSAHGDCSRSIGAGQRGQGRNGLGLQLRRAAGHHVHVRLAIRGRHHTSGLRSHSRPADDGHLSLQASHVGVDVPQPLRGLVEHLLEGDRVPLHLSDLHQHLWLRAGLQGNREGADLDGAKLRAARQVLEDVSLQGKLLRPHLRDRSVGLAFQPPVHAVERLCGRGGSQKQRGERGDLAEFQLPRQHRVRESNCWLLQHDLLVPPGRPSSEVTVLQSVAVSVFLEAPDLAAVPEELAGHRPRAQPNASRHIIIHAVEVPIETPARTRAAMLQQQRLRRSVVVRAVMHARVTHVRAAKHCRN
mmetsp:Transcript_9676/g.28629  ORF Transcript_9676/g.28629 Transcript_9676/m.28629 type:complete len:399 (-) Transcript_9676:62-1258(-)